MTDEELREWANAIPSGIFITVVEKITRDEVPALIDRARAAERKLEAAEKEIESLDRQYKEQHTQAADAVHVLTRMPLSHEDFSCCGCAICARVKEQMIDAGYLRRQIWDKKNLSIEKSPMNDKELRERARR